MTRHPCVTAGCNADRTTGRRCDSCAETVARNKSVGSLDVKWCLVPGCVGCFLASGLCARHYMQQRAGVPLTFPCDGICGKPHPVQEPPDPPLPPGLGDACTLILRMHTRR